MHFANNTIYGHSMDVHRFLTYSPISVAIRFKYLPGVYFLYSLGTQTVNKEFMVHKQICTCSADVEQPTHTHQE